MTISGKQIVLWVVLGCLLAVGLRMAVSSSGDEPDPCEGVVDECGVCDGPGIAEGACDCDGNVADECGVCGGPGCTSESITITGMGYLDGTYARDADDFNDKPKYSGV